MFLISAGFWDGGLGPATSSFCAFLPDVDVRTEGKLPGGPPPSLLAGHEPHGGFPPTRKCHQFIYPGTSQIMVKLP